MGKMLIEYILFAAVWTGAALFIVSLDLGLTSSMLAFGGTMYLYSKIESFLFA